jgi:hypothetical protein
MRTRGPTKRVRINGTDNADEKEKRYEGDGKEYRKLKHLGEFLKNPQQKRVSHQHKNQER